MSISGNKTNNLWALVLSLTIHLFLVFATGSHNADRDTKSTATTKELKINLVKEAVRPDAAGTKLANSDKDSSVPLTEPSSDPEPTPRPASALFEVSTPSEPYYFKPGELGAKPVVVSDVSPDLASTLTGEATQSAILRLLINEHGDIDKVIIEESGFSEPNRQLLLDSFAKMRFEPGKVDDKPVKSELKIEITLESIAPRTYPK
jgi:hypothetical protein